MVFFTREKSMQINFSCQNVSIENMYYVVNSYLLPDLAQNIGNCCGVLDPLLDIFISYIIVGAFKIDIDF